MGDRQAGFGQCRGDAALVTSAGFHGNHERLQSRQAADQVGQTSWIGGAGKHDRVGWFVGTLPIINANRDGSGQKWTLPVGAQAGRPIKFGDKLPVNLLTGAYYNALRPTGGATWQLRRLP